MYAEIKSLINNDTWTIVDRPHNGKVIGCRTVLRNKYNADGELEQRKARVVAKRFSQRPGVDFYDTFAPVAKLSSLRIHGCIRRKGHADPTNRHCDRLFEREDGYIDMENLEMLQEMLQRIVATEYEH